VLRRLFSGGANWTLDGVERPWPDDPPILDLVRAASREGGTGVASLLLPTEAPASGVPFAPGAWEGVVSHHVGVRRDDEQTRDLMRAIRALHDRATTARLAAVTRLATDVLGIADSLSTGIANSGLERPRVQAIGRVLAYEGVRSGPVKLGIVLVGMSGELHEDREPLMDLAGKLADEVSGKAGGTKKRKTRKKKQKDTEAVE